MPDFILLIIFTLQALLQELELFHHQIDNFKMTTLT